MNVVILRRDDKGDPSPASGLRKQGGSVDRGGPWKKIKR